MTLPGSCEKCAPFGGTWCEGPNGGMMRCRCARGMALVAAANPVARQPIMPAATAQGFAEMLTIMPFFPAGSGALASVADEIACMCETAEQGAWLVRRMRRMYQRWPGVAEMRLMLCSKYQPLDGIQATCESTIYLDGIPSESESQPLALPAAPRRRPAAADVTDAKSLQVTLAGLARKTAMGGTGRAHVSPVPVAPPPPPVPIENRITDADWEREKIRQRELRLTAAQ